MRAELVDALRIASSDRADASLSAADAALARAMGAQLPTLRGAWRSLVYDGTQRIGNDVDQHIARRGDDDSVSTQVALSLRRELRFSARSQRSPSQCSPPTKTAPSPLRRSSTTAANGSADRSSAASRPPPAPKRPPPPPPPPPSSPPPSDEAALATKRESGEITDRAGDDSGSAAEGSPRGLAHDPSTASAVRDCARRSDGAPQARHGLLTLCAADRGKYARSAAAWITSSTLI